MYSREYGEDDFLGDVIQRRLDQMIIENRLLKDRRIEGSLKSMQDLVGQWWSDNKIDGDEYEKYLELQDKLKHEIGVR